MTPDEYIVRRSGWSARQAKAYAFQIELTIKAAQEAQRKEDADKALGYEGVGGAAIAAKILGVQA